MIADADNYWLMLQPSRDGCKDSEITFDRYVNLILFKSLETRCLIRVGVSCKRIILFFETVEIKKFFFFFS